MDPFPYGVIFNISASRGLLNCARWAYDRIPASEHEERKNSVLQHFLIGCNEGFIGLVKWINSIEAVPIALQRTAFKNSCQANQIET
ncbi:MAG: hypothetical protein Hyperionvirus38_18, partial [Hyperionvirus sp.]